MDRVLYLLTGGCVSIAIAVFNVGKLKFNASDTTIAIVLFTIFAAFFLLMFWTPWGKAWRERRREAAAEANEEEYRRIRETGKVREPLNL